MMGVFYAITPMPVVELAGRYTCPLNELRLSNTSQFIRVMDVVDNVVVNVMGNPTSVQVSPRSFFSVILSSVSLAMTLSFP